MPDLTRRSLLAGGAAGVGAAALTPLVPAAALDAPASAAAPARPNVLWIVSEDNLPFLGCYGDPVARTPTLDALAADGVRYANAFSAAPVCAPSRFSIITGMYATTSGPAEHMRADAVVPDWMTGFPEQLRAAGYFTTNNDKTDYNAKLPLHRIWDESSSTAHWRDRPPGASFFSVFNLMITHEEYMVPGRSKPLPDGVQPGQVRIPPYLPDTPVMRAERALYYDQITRMDTQVAALLQQLADDGLAESTIVFYYSDHGGVLPRTKRFPLDSGTHTPLILRFPEAFRSLAPAAPGSVVTSPVSNIDFGPTVLTLAGLQVPDHVQGQSFVGAGSTARTYAFSSRDRMDETYDLQRTVRSERYRYIRNYRPDLPYGQFITFPSRLRGYKEWERRHVAGTLNAMQSAFYGPKEPEELYDLETDPDEVHNRIDEPALAEVRRTLSAALDAHLVDTNDNGFIPEATAPEGYEASRRTGAYPLKQVLDLARLASRRDASHAAAFRTALTDSNEVVRYWGAVGCALVPGGLPAEAARLVALLTDRVPAVRVVAAEALCVANRPQRALPVLADLLRNGDTVAVRLQAANSLAHLGEGARPVLDALQDAQHDHSKLVSDSATHTVAVLTGTYP